MSGKKRSYRKKLTSYGLIYLNGEELEISVKNLSITGMLAELQGNDTVYDTEDLFRAIEPSTIIDIYLPEMGIAGEAEITRADTQDEKMCLALEFRHLSYEVGNFLYKRKAYRKNMTAPGQIVFHDKQYQFITKNVSVEGITIMLTEFVIAHVGLITVFDFQKLELRGKIKVIWIDYLDDNSTLMGLQYIQMEKGSVQGIPKFLPSGGLGGY